MGGSGAEERDGVIVRRGEHGWVVGEENVSDLTSAMVLADLFAADRADGDQPDGAGAGSPAVARHDDAISAPAPRTLSGAPGDSGVSDVSGGVPGVRGVPDGAESPVATGEMAEAERLAVTVTQLEHALASRVRVEQAIGVLAERHRLRPREAFDLLRKASRARGRRVTELAHDVVESAANPLLQLPDELARKAPEPRQRSRSSRRGRHAM